jgi:hypothetical protein
MKRLEAVRSLGDTCGAMWVERAEESLMGERAYQSIDGSDYEPSEHVSILCLRAALNSSELGEQPRNGFIKKHQDIGCST